jgi:hypothetical protein
VTSSSLSSEVSSANSFAVLESLKGQDFPIKGCKDIINIDVTEMDMQKSQSPCFVPRGTNVTEIDMHKSVTHCFVPLASNVVNESVYPNKRARLEKIVKKVTFNLAITTEKDKEQCGVQVHQFEDPNNYKEGVPC